MELLHYLQQHFFTTEQLLKRSAISEDQLRHWQEHGLMPKPSYRLTLKISCDSFFGQHRDQYDADYYAKEYVSWIEQLRSLNSEHEAFGVFARRYRQRLEELAVSERWQVDDFTTDTHLAAEWRHFLDGTYGLCTVSGLPEDIAAKELAIALIRETAGAPALGDRDRLCRAVDLLDSVSSPFAPHEVARSSRRRYMDDMRSAHGL